MSDGAKAEETLDAIVATGDAVEAFLLEYCHQELSRHQGLSAIVGHSLPDVGLRLRPFLLRAAYEAGGRPFQDVLAVAAGIELIQLSTLVIDDVLDDSPVRNSRPSVLRQWGVKDAVCSGMVLSSLGLLLVSRSLEETSIFVNAIPVLRMLLRTHGDIYVGQFMDLSFEGNPAVREDDYLCMISKTTARFIQAPLVAGAMLWGASADRLALLGKAGLFLGMAYQLRDDVIDIVGDSEYTGKPVAGDIRQRKIRLPLVHALKRLPSEQTGEVLRLLRAGRALKQSQVNAIVRLLKRAGSIEYTIDKTRQYCSRVHDLLSVFPDDLKPVGKHLRAVASLISSFEEAGR